MSDDNALPIRDPFQIGITFVNQVVGSGFLNGNVNITLAAALFTPNDQNKVDPDVVIVSRLRMDLFAAEQLRDALTSIIQQNTKAPTAH